MPTVSVVRECQIKSTFRVEQVRGLFDIPRGGKWSFCRTVEVPDISESWQIGCIVGPSASGKSTVAEEAFGEYVFHGYSWPQDRAVVDAFDELDVRTIVSAFTAVGFGSPPSWLKPYRALSTGERFRCDLAAALLSGRECIVFDEFTSVVDRTVARIGSHAVGKAIRRHMVPARRFVAVTCHYDVLEWLEPDWVLDMASGELARRCLRRPRIEIAIVRTSRETWRMFAPHHYLSASITAGAQCYVAIWGDREVGFCAVASMAGLRGWKRIGRLVVLPDFQGIGIGGRLLDAVAGLTAGDGWRVRIIASHPAVRAHCRRSKQWRFVGLQIADSPSCKEPGSKRTIRTARGRAVEKYEFVGGG